MNIPDKVKVGGLTFAVEVVDKMDDDTAVGKTYFQDLKIKIGKANPDFMGQVFMHELIHAMNGEINETEVEFIAMSLFQIIKDNPQVFEGGGNNGRAK